VLILDTQRAVYIQEEAAGGRRGVYRCAGGTDVDNDPSGIDRHHDGHLLSRDQTRPLLKTATTTPMHQCAAELDTVEFVIRTNSEIIVGSLKLILRHPLNVLLHVCTKTQFFSYLSQTNEVDEKISKKVNFWVAHRNGYANGRGGGGAKFFIRTSTDGDIAAELPNSEQ